MKYYVLTICLAIFCASCSTPKYSVVTNVGGIDLKIDLKTNSKKFPSNPYTTSTPHLMSYSVTNLDKQKKFTPTGDGGTDIAYLLFTFLLSNNTMIEYKADLMSIEQISPLMTTTEQSMIVDLPKKEKLKDLVSVNIYYDNVLNQLGASTYDLRKHVSLDTGCPIDKIEVKDASEQLGNAIYILIVCGKEMKYRRIGTIFYKDGENPIMNQQNN